MRETVRMSWVEGEGWYCETVADVPETVIQQAIDTTIAQHERRFIGANRGPGKQRLWKALQDLRDGRVRFKTGALGPAEV